MSEEHRRRVTLTELVIVGFIFFLLAALLLPAVPMGRGESRTLTCANNLRQLALASVVREVSRSSNGFGGYLESQRFVDAAALPDEDPTTPERELIVAWPTRLLPMLELASLHEQILISDEQLDLNAPPRIDVFRCPADLQNDPEAAVLNYVVNSGMPDLANASATQPSDLRANGVCHDQRPGRFGPKVRSIDVKDGQSSTILLSENIHRDPAGSAQQPGNTWLRPAPGVANPEQWYGMTWLVDANDPRFPRAELTDRFNRDSRTGAELGQSYAASGTRFARPSSNHPGVFNVAFCEGNVKEIDQDIDYAVYQQLMTTDGHKAAPADAPDRPFEKTLPDDQRFMSPPLTDADF